VYSNKFLNQSKISVCSWLAKFRSDSSDSSSGQIGPSKEFSLVNDYLRVSAVMIW